MGDRFGALVSIDGAGNVIAAGYSNRPSPLFSVFKYDGESGATLWHSGVCCIGSANAVALDGAGPMHAARIASELGISKVLCPRAAGVLSALGLVVSSRRRDFARSVMLAGEELTRERVGAAVSDLEARAREEVAGARIDVSYDLRYRGQAFELTIEAPGRPSPKELRDRFDRVHEERYGYSDSEAELELVNVRVAAVVEGTRPAAGGPGGLPDYRPGGPGRASRRAFFGPHRLETAVVRGDLPAGERIAGPAVCELPEATAVIPPGWVGEVRGDGTLVLERLCC